MKRLIILSLMILSINVIFADCDMAAMIAKSGYSISDLDAGSGDYDDPDEFIDFLINYSTANTNHDGYGITYIDENGYFPYINTTNCVLNFNSPQAFYLTAQNILSDIYYYSYNNGTTHPYQGPMNNAQIVINDNNNDVAILLGHVRRSDTAKGNHPFRFIYDTNTTFQFIHNGGIDSDIKLALFNELGANWFSETNHPSNWWDTNNGTPSYNQLIDSEILFHWIMKNIIDNNGDILLGIQLALTATVGSIDLEYEFNNPYYQSNYWHNVVNFTLTDGENLYLFRSGENSWNHHLLSWQENDNNIYTVKTQSVLNNPLNQFDLVILSRDDDPIVYNDFFDLDLKTFSPGVTWVSFPRLIQQYSYTNGENYEQAYWNTTLQTPGLLQSTLNGGPTINDFDIIRGNRILNANINYVAPNFIDQGFNNMLFRHEGYKITVASGADPTTLVVNGDRLLETYTISEALPAYTENWLGYWLPESRNIVDAFGDFWEYVEEVWAEDWYYNKCSNNRGIGEAEPVSWSTANKTLEYGKGYIVQFKRILEIEDFCWTPSSTTEEPTKKAESENFSFIEKSDYEVIDIVDIPGSVAEIGVLQDDVCVGAVVVENECEQLLVYSESANREEVPFTFEVVTNNRSMNQTISKYLVLNENTGEFENGNVISGEQINSIVKFHDIEELENVTPIISSIKLHGNYPNPFNPTTQISFSLPVEEEIDLIIYNVKGQKVKTLFSGCAAKGKHSLTWEGKDNNDKSVSSGIYFYKLKTNNKELTRKMLMMK